MSQENDLVQRTLNWHAQRLGNITSTAAKRVLGGPRGKDTLVKRLRFELDLRERMSVAISSGEGLDEIMDEFREYIGPELNVPALKWGRTMEPRGLQAAQLRFDCEFQFPGSIEHAIPVTPQYRPVRSHEDVRVCTVATSPDAMWDRVPVECKCPYNEAVHEKVFVDGPWQEHGPQLTMHALVAGVNEVLFISFDPRANNVPMLYTERVVVPQTEIDWLRDGCIEVWRHVVEGTSPLDNDDSAIPRLF